MTSNRFFIKDKPQDTSQIFLEGNEHHHLSKVARIKPGDFVFHCSGSLSSDILGAVERQGAYTASVHPIHSFADPSRSISNFQNTFCAIEGHTNAIEILTKLFTAIGGNVFNITKDKKKLYHAGGVVASNYLVTLSFLAMQCYKEAGVSEETAKQIVNSLMSGTLNNLQYNAHNAALTGPIQRGDINTVSGHMYAFQANQNMALLYSLMGKQTIQLTDHTPEKRKQLEEALSRRCKL